MNTTKTRAYSAASATALLASTQINRRNPTDRDVQIEILFCGVCHSDLHFARNEWGFTQYPAVPGHEIVGRVTAVGGGVKKFKVCTDFEYGKNITSPNNPRETQPHWYVSKFEDLLDLVMPAKPMGATA